MRDLIEQAQAIASWSGQPTPTFDALLEAFLVHARLLDDFLGKHRPYGDDVLARHYVTAWTPARYLTQAEQDDVDAQVAHLAARRQMFRQWDVGAITTRACAGLEAFHAQLPGARRSYFKQIPHSIRRWRGVPSRLAVATTSSP